MNAELEIKQTSGATEGIREVNEVIVFASWGT
jgi:hypothetical protein